MKCVPCGDDAVLLDCVDVEERRRWMSTLTVNPPRGLADAVPASTTILLRFAAPMALAKFLETSRQQTLLATNAPPVGRSLQLAVRYDGADIDDVCAHLGWTREQLIAWHTGQEWVCDFVGFLPGFGYLVAPEAIDIPRKPTPRVKIPAGAVALAGSYTGVYPRESPGGWQLIGTTSIPSPYPAGTRIRFSPIR